MPSETLNTNALTTLNSLKRFLGIATSDTSQDTLLTEAINAASARIERVCGRKFKGRAYRERINGASQEVVNVRNWPIINVSRAKYGRGEAFSLSYTGGSAIDATAAVYFDDEMTAAGSGLRLVSVATNGTETATTSGLDFNTCKSVSALVDAVNAVSGWTATLLHNAPSMDLNPDLLSDVNGTTGTVTYADNDLHVTVVDFQRGQVQIRTHPHAVPWEPHAPPFAITHGFRTPRGFQNVLVGYTGGYATIPDDIAQLCNELAGMVYQATLHDQGVQSETIGDYSYTLATDGDGATIGAMSDAAIASRLASYMEVR